MAEYGNMNRGFAGLTQGLDKEVISRLAGVELAFGDAVFAATGDSTKVTKTQTGELLGVAMHTQKYPAKYEVGDAVNIQNSGKILVAVAVAISAQQPAYLTPAGAWTNVSTDNLATNFIFREGSAGAGIVELEIIKKGAL